MSSRSPVYRKKPKPSSKKPNASMFPSGGGSSPYAITGIPSLPPSAIHMKKTKGKSSQEDLNTTFLNHIFYGAPLTDSLGGAVGLHAYGDAEMADMLAFPPPFIAKMFEDNPTLKDALQNDPTLITNGLPSNISPLGYIGGIDRVHILHWALSPKDQKFSSMLPITTPCRTAIDMFLKAKDDPAPMSTHYVEMGPYAFDFEGTGKTASSPGTIFPIGRDVPNDQLTIGILNSSLGAQISGKTSRKATINDIYLAIRDKRSDIVIRLLNQYGIYHSFTPD